MYTAEDFCEGGIWNTSLFVDESWPQFTPCFVSIVPTWIPSFYVWLLIPCFIRKINKYTRGERNKPSVDDTHTNTANGQSKGHLVQETKNHAPITTICALKIFLLLLQAAVSAVEVIRLLSTDPVAVEVLSGFMILITYGLLCFFTWFERRKGQNPCYIYFFFFALMLVLGAARVYMWIFIWGIGNEIFPFAIVIIQYVVNLVCFVLAFLSDNTTRPSLTQYQTIGRPECPEHTSPYPSQLFFTWMRSLMIAGFRGDLTYEDVWKMNPRDTSSVLVPSFERLWSEEHERVKKINKKRGLLNDERNNDQPSKISRSPSIHYDNEAAPESIPLFHNSVSIQYKTIDGLSEKRKEAKPNIFVVMAKLLWKQVVFGVTLKVIGDAFQFLGPVILGALITCLQNPDDNKQWQAYTLAVMLMATGLCRSVLFAQSMYSGSLISLQMKTVLTNAIYKKALSISGSAKKIMTVGDVVNLMSVDCQRLQEMMAMFLFTWSVPIQLVMAITLLYQVLGVSSLAGVALMVLTVPVNHMVASKQKILQAETLATKDKRIRLVNEILNGMKVLKLYAWEMEFKKKVEAIRQIEILKLFKIANIFIIINTVAGLMPFLVGMVTFMTYVLMDREHVLDAGKAFVSLALFNLLRVPCIYFTIAIVYSVQTNICLKRISAFLNCDDLDTSTVTHDLTNKDAVVVKSGTFSWDTNSRPVLDNINIEIPEGCLVAVVGTIGSGKSSLISAILGEIHKLQGLVNVKGKVGYVSQQAWIQNATVRDNILFGNKYNRRKYNTTTKACQLLQDLQILEAGDQTEIGEKGINLSGGQKQRINLARAAYSQSDVFLLDDPLSAVDAHVGNAIFDQLIGPEGLLAGKTRILVTHGIHYLHKVDLILVLSDGHIVEKGSYKELLDGSGYFSAVMDLYGNKDNEKAALESDEYMSNNELDEEKNPGLRERRKRGERKMSEPTKFQDSFEMSLTETSLALSNSVKNIYPESGKLTMLEKLETGKISFDVYTTYARAAGVIALPIAYLSYIMFYGLQIFSTFWLTAWTDDSVFLNETTKTSNEAVSTSNYYLLVYCLLGFGLVVTHTIYSILFWFAMVKAGKRIHGLLLECLFHAPMSFFDQTPMGRILNRFSRDVDIVDNNLPLVIKDFSVTFMVVIATMVVLLIQTPIFGVALIPLLILFFLAENLYVRTSRQLKRMESITRSPVYTHFSETMTGASVIRAYGATERFIEEAKSRIDDNQLYYFASQAAIRWLQLNLDVLSNMVVLCSALFQILGGGNGSDAGLSVSYALQITGIMTYMVRQVCEFETNIVCVERMKEYTRIDQEADLIYPHNRPEKEWPEYGNIDFCDYTLRYRPGLQLVLKGVNCEIKNGEKVGIVGRTGAGKSSLTLALFRIIEAAGGHIKIDGVNIAEIGLHDLRKRLTILPQDPVLFCGSLRLNIDPFNEYSDEELWLALERAHLKDFVSDHREGLLYECGEEGTNLSVGQRQLVCLARALLRKTKILILDEATAAVDLETDALIQTTISTAFQECTVLAIAHRLKTIMDYDKVIVMDAGIVMEFDSPQSLLQQRGIFYSMCKDAGLA